MSIYAYSFKRQHGGHNEDLKISKDMGEGLLFFTNNHMCVEAYVNVD